MAPTAGQTVMVHYRGTLSDGTEFDSSRDRAPLQFTVGEGQVIPGFDAAVADLGIGETTTVTIPADQAYGGRENDAVQEFPIDAFPEPPEEGWTVELAAPDGQRLAATVAHVGPETATLDFNHPLAGEDLTFEIELLEVIDGAVEAEES